MNPADFAFLSGMLKARSGLFLTPDKEYLLENRLMPIAKRHGCGDLGAFATFLRGSRDEALSREIVEAMTTNESMFFRDIRPFDQLKNVALPKIMETKKGRTLRIWSAACSNGQEPYSIAMTLLEQKLVFGDTRFEILATDLDRQVLNKSREGVYSQFEAQRGMPVAMLVKYFAQAEGGQWQIKEEVKRLVSFKEHNLLETAQHLGRFDIIFCRNVLIYFDEDTKKSVFQRLAGQMEPGGFLILGAAESAFAYCDRFMPVEGYTGLQRLRA